jgi:hypothetical protein
VDEVLRDAPDVTTAAGVTSEDAIVGPTVERFLHEIGHAIFNLLKVPLMGREEGAADQFAAYEMVHLDNDLARQTVGKPEQRALRGLSPERETPPHGIPPKTAPSLRDRA